jgi:hypothetical protein
VNISIKLTEDSQLFISRLKDFRRKFLSELVQTSDNVGAMLGNKTRSGLLDQSLGLPAISEVWKKWKTKRGLSPNILVMTQDMADAITYRRLSTGASMIKGQVGFKESTLHRHYSDKRKMWNPKKKKMSVFSRAIPTWYLARIHDEGLGHVRRRQFFKAVVDLHGDEVAKRFDKVFLKAWMI